MIDFLKRWALPLRWWLIFTLVNLSVVVCYFTGLIDTIQSKDFTKLSFVIFIVFYIMTIKQGILAWRYSKSTNRNKHTLNMFELQAEPAWFISEALLTIGMFGTVLGFIYMLSTSLAGVSSTNLMSIQIAMSNMSTGMSAALFTTASALACGLVLKFQTFDFSHTIGKEYLNAENK